MVGVPKYDEAAIALAAQRLTRGERTAFAAACAERLWPLVERYAATIALPSDSLRGLREALEAAWAAAGGHADRLALETAKAVAEELIPSEDDDNWVFESGYAQNGIAAIAYAIDTRLRDGVQEAVWAGRQVYEAADYVAQQRLDTELLYTPELEEELSNTPVAQAAVRSILEDLAMANTEEAQVIRQRIISSSHGFASLFP